MSGQDPRYKLDAVFKKVGGLWPPEKPGAKWFYRGKINIQGRKLSITIMPRSPNDVREKAPVTIWMEVPKDMWAGWHRTVDANDESGDPQ